jgi:hypothetical protein
MHAWVAEQRVPQAPQLLESVVGSTHVPLHRRRGAVHVVLAQVPMVQVSPGPQRRPQAPQLFSSVRMSAQPMPHSTRPPVQMLLQNPSVQSSAAPQRLLQRPQLAGSRRTSVQPPLHSRSGARHMPAVHAPSWQS